jgi:hypothetical protein
MGGTTATALQSYCEWVLGQEVCGKVLRRMMKCLGKKICDFFGAKEAK